jgi:hypothetical protein
MINVCPRVDHWVANVRYWPIADIAAMCAFGSFIGSEVAMLSNLPTMDQRQLVISQAAAPAFILGAVASFLSVLLSHMARITDRSRAIHGLAEGDPKKGLKGIVPQLRLRARILHRAIYWAVGSGIVTCLLMIVAFGSAYFGVRHEPGAAVLFIAALGLFTASLVSFAREVGIALKRPEAD